MSSLPLGAINLIVSNSILCALATVSVVLRFVSIHRLKRDIRLHDWLTVVALTTMYGQAVCAMIGAVSGGYGLHILEVLFKNPEKIVIVEKTVFVATLFWLLSTSAFRSAILVLYLELFGSSIPFRYCCYVLQAIFVLFLIAGTTTSLSLCHPIERNWNRAVPGHCGDGNTALLASAIVGTILDIVTVVLPLPIVWRLQMAVQKKVAITATFALGLSICGINIARMAITELCDASDFTYCTPYSLIFVLCEMAGGILVACVPTLGPVFFPQRYKATKAADNSWKHLDKDKIGKTPRTAKAAMSDEEMLAEDFDFLDLDEIHGSSKEKIFGDSSNPKRRSSSTAVRKESKYGVI